jgi:DNA polymerase (family 10)
MKEGLSNKEISSVIKQLGALMELHGENPFKVKSYNNAAFQIGRFGEKVWDMDLSELESTKGIGKSVAARIAELRSEGEIPLLSNLLEKTPAGVVDILGIKGLGAKKVAQIWKELGVESTGELLYACNENRLASMKGFGEKTQQKVIESIEFMRANSGKAHYAVAEAEAEFMETQWKAKGLTVPARTGALRRMDNVIDALEWLLYSEEQVDSFSQQEEFIKGDNLFTGSSVNGLKVLLHVAEQFGRDQFLLTGHPDHVQHIRNLNGFSEQALTEEDIYASVGYPVIPPELRMDLAEWDLAASGFDGLLRQEDIRGVVHNHSTWSDGKHSVEEMAGACLKKGYEYLVMSDHSVSAFYANGLDAARVRQQQAEIDGLNASLLPFRIFKSIESDILYDGALDYPDDVLSSFDLVIASVHSQLRMKEEKAMERLLNAIRNPYTNILGHMTGRLLLSRPGYPVDHKTIIDACAANNVAIEVNANPYRLDIDYNWLPYAQEKGVLISINPDAHSTDGIDDIRYGVISARKGGLLKQNTLNACNLEAFNRWLEEQHRKRP